MSLENNRHSVLFVPLPDPRIDLGAPDSPLLGTILARHEVHFVNIQYSVVYSMMEDDILLLMN